MANAHNFSSGNFDKKKSRKNMKKTKITSGRGSAHNGRGTPITRKTKLGIDINIIFKFHPNRITSHEVVL